VLHSRAFRNTSLVLELLTERRGRCGVVARGGKRNPLLQPFRPLAVSLGGRGELLQLRHVEAAGPAPSLKGRALYCGLYIHEILLRLLHRDDPHPELLAPYAGTLSALDQGGNPQDVVLRRFEMVLLDSLGYGFALDQDDRGRSLEPGARYRLEPERGLVRASEGWPGETLLELAGGHWSAPVRAVARELMREALGHHLGPAELTSRRLFRGAD
jgi:DNA repair protein RecO (recombination protein O)